MLAADVTPRPRLSALIQRGVERKLLLVIAPAGYGKTTAVLSWVLEQPEPIAWLSLNAAPDDLLSFVAYIVAAVQQVAPDVCATTERLAQSGQAPAAVLLAALVNDLEGSSRRIVLVLDDYDTISVGATHDFMAALVDALPATIRLIMTARASPPLPLARWRGSGTRVLPPQSTDSNFLHAVSINDFQSYSENWDFDMQVIEVRKLDKEFASWVGTSPDEEWLAIHGVSRTYGAKHPECWVRLYVHKDYAAISRLVTTHPGPVFKLIEDMFGQTIVELTQEISAELVPKRLAKMLEVEPGSAAIVVRRVFKTADGKIVEAALETYPASRFRYQVNLHRSDGKHAS